MIIDQFLFAPVYLRFGRQIAGGHNLLTADYMNFKLAVL